MGSGVVLDPRDREALTVELPKDLLGEARELQVDIEHVCERGLRAEVRRLRGERWVQDNMAAIESWNAYVEEHGLPFAEYRGIDAAT